jgi:dipeptidyl aminopeptidase/acylaminoacyl peptidase
VRTEGRRLVAVARSADREAEVVRISTGGAVPSIEVLREGRRLGLDPADISRGQPISFPSADGRTAHAHFYPPANAKFAAPAGELPPLLVLSHGGPTAAASAAFQLNIQYWTSRGFALVDVDYGGSTGYGRQYRKALEGTWGIVDVEDCCAAAEYLVANGLVDGNRLAIRGGSAGGFTTLAALAFKDTFHAGANHFGVSDMGALAAETHKFESRYLDSLVGPYPEAKAIYDERSPINHVEGFAVPLITFQGLEDAVVLPNQSERICQALDAKGVPHAYLAFEGEQHGFRRADTIRTVHDAELSFYGQVFGFEPHGVAQPVQLNHADKLSSRGTGPESGPEPLS